MKTSTVLRLPYLAVRAPLTLADPHLAQRLRIDSWPLLTLDRVRETVDTVTDHAFRTDRVHGGHLHKLTAIIDETAAAGSVNPRRPRATVSTARTTEHRASTPATVAGAQHLSSTAATGKKYAHVRSAAATDQTAAKNVRR